MLEFLRGQRESITKICGSCELDIEFYHKGSMEIDTTCFGLDAAGRLSDEQYFIFYNHTESPESAVQCMAGAAADTTRFHLCLDKLPPHIAKLSFAAAIDGTKTLRELNKGYARLLLGEREIARYAYSGVEFTGERAIVVCEIYRKGGDWRFSAVGRGFNGGLKALVESFGGVVQSPAPSPPCASPKRAAENKAKPTPVHNGTPSVQRLTSVLPAEVAERMENLARLCRGETEYLRSLYKSMFSCLAAIPQAAKTPVNTVLCTDISGSMFDMYRSGRIQRAVDKFFVFASTLCESAVMDLWAFAAKSRQFEPVTMDNVRSYTFDVSSGFERWMSMLNYQYNNEPEAMRDVTMIYGGRQKPVMVLFLTDGRLSSDWEIEEILIKTSRLPIFWQFIGLHGEQYGVLDALDEINGRYIENANFIKLDDIDDLSDTALYSRLLEALSEWMEELRSKKMLSE